MPLAMPEVDVSILEELDWEESLACEWVVRVASTDEVVETCDAEATWVARFPCCGRTMLMCDRHQPELDNLIRSAGKPRHMICGGWITADITWSRLDA